MKVLQLPLLCLSLMSIVSEAEQVSDPNPAIVGAGQSGLTPPRQREAELSARYDLLDNGYEDQQTLRLDLVSTRSGHTTYYGSLIREQRFGLADHAVELGAAFPLNSRWSAYTEVGFAQPPDFRPTAFVEAGAERRFALGLGLRAGYRRSFYDTRWVDRLALTTDRYWGAYRGAYTLNMTWLETTDLALAHSVSLTRYYGDRSFWGGRAALGEEKELDTRRRVLVTQTASIGLFGRHWYRPRWALGWDFDVSRQGDLYNRFGVRLGIRHAY